MLIRSLVLICLVALTNADDLAVGDACQIRESGETGICQLSPYCPIVRDLFRFSRIRPTSCGYRKNTQIVCCPITAVTEDKPEAKEEIKPVESISERKCREYSQYIFSNVSVLLLSADDNESLVKVSTDSCGHRVVPLILGGTLADPKEFPHSALLGYKTKLDGKIAWDCGGSLISRRFVLTAGHCINSSEHEVQVSVVRLGDLVLNDETDDAAAIDVAIEKIIMNSDYRKRRRYNDIALLKLAQRIALSPYIVPICLPTANLEPAKSIATGWGAVERSGTVKSDALFKVVLDVFSNTECNRLVFQYNINSKLPNGIIETQMCAGSRTKDLTDTCQGDSGGPLQIYHPDNVYCMYTQVGITSFGIGCGFQNSPSVYTRVHKYVSWIESVVWLSGETD